jgi:hypothetical protein
MQQQKQPITKMQVNYSRIILALAPMHSTGTQFIKEYAVQIGALLASLINLYNEPVLTELSDCLQHVLLSYMYDINCIIDYTMPDDNCDCISRKDLLVEINNMIKYQKKNSDNIEEAKKLFFSVY